MRPGRLVRIAAEAEILRLRGMITRIAVRTALAGVALVFLLGALTSAHIAAWYWLRINLGQSFLATSGILGGLDLLIGIVCGLLASRSRPGRVEREALLVRRQAVAGLGNAFSLIQFASPLLQFVSNRGRQRRR
jgi:hypothetical protein